LALSEQACEFCGIASRTSSADGCLPGIGPESRVIPTCELLWPTPVAHDDGKTFEAHMAMKARMVGGPRKTPTSLTVVTKASERGQWCPCRCHTSMSSAAASPARTSATPAPVPGSTDHSRVFGGSSLASLATYDPATSSWRTSQLSLLEDSTPSLGTLPRAGSMRNGTVFQRRPLAPLTDATASGLLHTPTATANQDASSMRDRDAGSWFRTPKASDAEHPGRQAPSKPGQTLTLPQQVQRWPTPHGFPKEGQARNPGPSGNELGRAVNREMWPTPTGQDAANDGGPSQFERNSLPLNAAVKCPTPMSSRRGGRSKASIEAGGGITLQQATQAGGSLNPTWVEWLMGFPLGWTDCGR
jgi:hypothetical protein